MKKILIDRNEIKSICQRLGNKLTDLFKDNKIPPVFIGVLKGATPFMMDLIKEVKCHIELDFVQYSSYEKTNNTGVLVMKKDISSDIKNRDVVVIEDICDTGKTLQKLYSYLESYNPSKIYTCCLLDKPSRRIVDFKVDFIGKEIQDLFVIGYGLDYSEMYRNYQDIFYIEGDDEELKQIDKMKEGK